MKDFQIHFDNGGGATLQVRDDQFVHHYDDMQQLATDVGALLKGDIFKLWDGHEPEFYLSDDYVQDHSANGGLYVLDGRRVSTDMDCIDNMGHAAHRFWQHLYTLGRN